MSADDRLIDVIQAAWGRSRNIIRSPQVHDRPLSQSQINAQERLKCQDWLKYRSWHRITSGVLLDVIGAVQYGTSRVFYKIVPHFNANEFGQYIVRQESLARWERRFI